MNQLINTISKKVSPAEYTLVANQLNLHLATLDSNDIAEFHFRAMKGKLIKQLSSSDKNWQDEVLSLISQKYELFVTVNETNGKGLKAADVTKVRALFLDMDKTEQDNLAIIETMPLPPNLVVNTSKGKFHCYWDVGDCPLDQFKSMQKALATKYYGDLSVSDLPRIMRLAGSYHRKKEPYFVSVVSHHSDTYTLDEFKSAFSFDSFGSAHIEGFHKNNTEIPISRTDAINQKINNIHLGNNLHESLLSLAGYFAKDGMSAQSITLYLQSQMKISLAEKDSRFFERLNEIVGIADYVTSNRKKEAANEYWPEPTSLISELRPVKSLDVGLLPIVMQELVNDSAERMQCPPDFLAAGLIVTSSSIIARNVVIQPKQEDTAWTEHPNLWGAIIGKPSLLKSPTLSIAMSALEKLERQSRESHKDELKEFNVDCDLAEIAEKNNKKKAESLLKNGKRDEAKAILLADQVDDEDEPAQARYVINDGTIEKIADLLCSNTSGLLVFRDELSGWFNNLNKPDKTNDRSFLLESWNGNKPYTVDRIGRGTTHIPTNRLSILGGIQPDMFSKIVNASSSGSQGGDGLLQRFQIAVYPDVGKVSFVDRAPNKAAIKQFENKVLSLAQWSDEATEQLVLKFSDSAYRLYKKWFTENESLFRDDELSPSLEAHYAKYRGLVPSVAGIFYVLNSADFETKPLIDEATILSAIAYVEYLRSHAERIYALPEQFVLKGAKTILTNFNKLGADFTLRDVKRRKWAGLADGDVVEAALSILEEHGYCQQLETSNGKGRPSINFVKHPKYQLPKLTKPLINSTTTIIKEDLPCKN